MSQPSPSHIRATAVRVATLRRLALSVLFTIATTSYQTTCTVSERTFNKRQHANARYRVESFTLYALRQSLSLDWRLASGKSWIRHCILTARLGNNSVGGFKGAPPACVQHPQPQPLMARNLLNFMQFLWKFWQNRILTPPTRIVAPFLRPGPLQLITQEH